MSAQFNYELTKEGMAKMATLKRMPDAYRRQLTDWLTGTVQETMRSAGEMQKSISKYNKKTSQMGRNVGMEVGEIGGALAGKVGTGVGKKQSVKYARIQDEGGTTHPQITDKMKKFFWAMYFAHGGQASAKSGLKTKRIGRKRGESGDAFASRFLARSDAASKWKGLALTKRTELTVKIPASHWFTKVIDARRATLDYMMSADAVLTTAEKMAGTYAPNEWR